LFSQVSEDVSCIVGWAMFAYTLGGSKLHLMDAVRRIVGKSDR
jgi:hypothetical protein